MNKLDKIEYLKDDEVTPAEAATFLDLSVNTLKKWRCLKIGPSYIKNGRSIKYLLKDLREYKYKTCRVELSS